MNKDALAPLREIVENVQTCKTFIELLKRLEARGAQKSDGLLISQTKSISSLQFLESTELVVHTLRLRGVARGQRIAIVGQDAREILPPLFAAWTLGLVPAIVAPNSGQQIAIFDAQWVLDSSGLSDRRVSSVAPVLPPGTELVLFTLGAHGETLAVCHRKESLFAGSRAVAQWVRIRALDRLLANAPLSSMGGLVNFFACVLSDASLVSIHPGHFGDDLIQAVNQLRCTGFAGTPVDLERVVQTARREPSTGFRFWMTSGDGLRGESLQKAKEIFPSVQFFPLYGLTEVAGRLCGLDPRDQARRPGSLGKPLGDMQIEIVTPLGKARPLESGQLVVTGPLLFSGYLGENQTRTSLATGDRGYQDADGFFWWEGRDDDLFKSAGEKISSARIRNAVLDLGEFTEVEIVAIEDPFSGRVPCAFVIPKKGTIFNRRAAVTSLKNTLPVNHIPKRWVVVEKLPSQMSDLPISRSLPRMVRRPLV